jgi:hypothetical protein
MVTGAEGSCEVELPIIDLGVRSTLLAGGLEGE